MASNLLISHGFSRRCPWCDLVFDSDHTKVSLFLVGCHWKDREDPKLLRLNP